MVHVVTQAEVRGPDVVDQRDRVAQVLDDRRGEARVGAHWLERQRDPELVGDMGGAP